MNPLARWPSRPFSAEKYLLPPAPHAYSPDGDMSSSSRTSSTTKTLINVHFYDNSWSQAKLPVRHSGLGLRTGTDMALSVSMSSHAASNRFVSDILCQPSNTQENDDEVRALLDRNLDLSSDIHEQRNGDSIQCSLADSVLVPVLNQYCLACFKAASRPESRAWLHSVLVNSVCTFIDNGTLLTDVALRVGL